MKLIKVKDGLLETENFFLVSPFNDFAGDTNVTRDISTGKLKIISDNKIERLFNYNEFVIEVYKENFNALGLDDYSILYLGNDDYNFGIREDKDNNQNKYWKILKQDNHIQAYSSPDGVIYTNIGGMEFSEILTKQGFIKHHTEDLILNDYKVYSNPYVTLQNFPENTTCEFYDLNNQLIRIRLFDNNMECKVYLDSNTQGYFVFKDVDGNVIYTTDNLDLTYGDIWVISPYNFEISYLGNIVTNINPSLLQDLDEIVAIKNIGNSDYTINIGTQTSGNDLIELSLDGITFANTIDLNILQNEEKNIFIRITKNVDNHNFKVRDFQLVINE